MQASTLQFLTALSKNNNREWFAENKALYTTARADVLDFIDQIIEKVGSFDKDVAKLEATNTLFRIYRDIRFSSDKSPYKTHFGASIGMGKGHKISGYYIHIEPGNSFIAGGIYRPEPNILKKIRIEISQNPKSFKKILENNHFRNNFRGLTVEDKLKRVPNGFDKDDPMAEFLKLKSFVVTHPVSDAEVLNPNAIENFSKIFRSVKPMNDFLEAPFL